ncbi:uncharacterized protein N7469_005181 [Penicillium citrinum]|uniref:Transmembrane protein n=1 Tax=Penicillium citrinum TaxID=5077 RepID=A0A9W9P1K5_PENCI|nr:uncharacterized protein N7469_005181 [Penicillium citrinum]KAJ5233415.1 hypothetical protein N7469_005181 [Penicillium citrinum]
MPGRTYHCLVLSALWVILVCIIPAACAPSPLTSASAHYLLVGSSAPAASAASAYASGRLSKSKSASAPSPAAAPVASAQSASGLDYETLLGLPSPDADGVYHLKLEDLKNIYYKRPVSKDRDTLQILVGIGKLFSIVGGLFVWTTQRHWLPNWLWLRRLVKERGPDSAAIGTQTDGPVMMEEGSQTNLSLMGSQTLALQYPERVILLPRSLLGLRRPALQPYFSPSPVE